MRKETGKSKSSRSGLPLPAKTSQVFGKPSYSSSPTQQQQAEQPHHAKFVADGGFNFGRVPILAPTTAAIQPKPTVGQPNDKYEVEADRVAEQVMHPKGISSGVRISQSGIRHQKAVKGSGESKAIVQTKALPGSTTAVSSTVTSGFQSLTAGGQPLPGSERGFFESRFKHNFGNVKVHHEREDTLLADALQAQAFTYGNHIFLGSQNKSFNRHLMAHELTHVIQQKNGINLRRATWLERRAWLAFFDHYLPRKFLNNYMDDTGNAITLTQREMQDCNPVVNIRRSRAIMSDVASLRASGGGSKTSSWSGWGGALTNGTLGNFTINYQGTLTVNADGSWNFSGTMTFYDYWDFNTGGANRPLPAEVKVRVASTFLPGQPFHIYSQQAAVSQSSSDSRATWGASAPVHVPDRAGRTGADIAVGDVGGGEVGGEVGAQSSEDLN